MDWLYVAIAVVVVGLLTDTLLRVSELSHRVRRVEQKLDAALKGLDIPNPDSTMSSDNWKSLARDPGRKIQAIGAYRKETGAGFAEAKQAVEAWIEQGDK